MSGAAVQVEASLARDEAIREQARQILAREDYAQWREPLSLPAQWLRDLARWLGDLGEWMPDWLVAAWDGLAELLSSLYDAMRAGSGGSGALLPTQILGAIAMGALVIVVIFLVAQVRRARAARAPVARSAGGTAEPTWVASAERLAREGQTLAAAHQLQLGVIRLLVEGRWLELERSEPNRTLRRRIQQTRLPDDERRDLLDLVDRLELQWFRDRAEDHSLYQAWRRLHARLAQLGAAG